MFPIHLWLFCSWFCIFDGHLVIMSCCLLSCLSHAAVCTETYVGGRLIHNTSESEVHFVGFLTVNYAY
jgi:hypothetical protein